MDILIHNLRPDSRKENLDILGLPILNRNKIFQNDALHAVEELFAMIEADGAKIPVSRPGAERELVDVFPDVCEAGVSHHGLEMRRDAQIEAFARRGAFEDGKVLGESVVAGDGAVVAGGHNVHFCNLDPAPWFCGYHGLVDEAWPVENRREHVSDVHQIERVFGPEPVAFYVVDFEVEVWGRP